MIDKKSNKNKSEQDPVFYIDSWSALSDFAKSSPKSILEISAPRKDENRLHKLLTDRNISVPLSVSAKGLSAKVRIATMDEVALTKRLSQDLPPVILVIDHITDPRNFGAIIRSAAFFGVSDVVVAKDRQAPVTQGTIDTCQGAIAFTSIYRVTNISRAVKEIKDQGFWVVGAILGGEKNAKAVKFDHTCLVVGSEDKGISQSMKKNVDVAFEIAGANVVDSLNVSVATGIMLSQLCK